MTIKNLLQSHRGRALFAFIWVAALSACWPPLRSSALFQRLLGRGADFDFLLSLLYLTAIMHFAILLILLLGLAVYLAATSQSKWKSLLRGFCVMVAVLLVMEGIEGFLRGANLSVPAQYVLTWLPVFLALFAGVEAAPGMARRLPATRSAAQGL